MGPLTGEHRPHIPPRGGWSARPSLTHNRPRPTPCPAYSEIRRVRRGDRGLSAEKGRVLSADRFRPVVAGETTIGNPSRSGRGEGAFILHRELDLQPPFGGVWVDGGAPIRGKTGPIYGSVLSLGFGGGFAVAQAVAPDRT